MSTQLSRRRFLKLSSLAAASTALTSIRFPAFASQSDLVVFLRSPTIPESGQLLTSLVKYYGKSSNIAVSLSLLSRQQLADALESTLKSGSGPDVIQTTHLHAYEHADMLVDVSEICESLGTANDGWYDVAREMCVVDGVWRALPQFFESRLMVYRKDFFEQAGASAFPTTWNDLLIVGKKLKANGKPLGFTLGHTTGDGNCFAYSLLWSFGASLTDENGKISLDSQATRQVIAFVEQLYHDAMLESVTSWDDLSNNSKFLEGNISCTYNGASILWQAEHAGLEFLDKIDHAPFPAGPAGAVILPEVYTLEIPKSSTHIDQSKGLLSYLNSREVALPLASGSFAMVTPLTRAYEDHPAMPWNTDPRLSGFKGHAATGKSINYPAKPSAEASIAARNFVIVDMFARVCSGQSTVDESINQAVQAAEQIYKK